MILALECTDILLSILCQCRDHMNLVNLVSFSGDVWHSTLNYLHFIKPSSYSLDLERICSPGKHIHSNPKYIQLYLNKCFIVDIVQCADGFYETNGSCLPSCSTFREVDDSTAKSVLILYYLGFGFSAIFCTIYFIVILMKKKKV